ncbi:AI-2E family transporter [Aurantibacter aestuarii]|uniref:AI-2E family transporter n=1 Tax=Aurantibacter aestuarii TaxID=1266046 RepID=A0A2T1N4J2_9FLAO|nr:AI-2E family transporter [Aurantibacter aestuarii]PSG86066.1 AI-2E family transporter [Aurantibacter aestuarii]
MNDTIITPKLTRQVFVLSLILFMGILIFRELIPYLSGVLGAVTIFLLLRPWMNTLIQKGWKKSLAALLLMFLSFVCILLPISAIVIMLGNKIGDAVKNSEQVVTAFKKQMENIESFLGYDLTSNIDASKISDWISNNAKGFADSTLNISIAIGLMYFMLYYMFTNSDKLIKYLHKYIPIKEKNLKIIGSECQTMVRSNAIGIPLVAFAQGIIALIGFLIFGIKDPFFWFMLVTVGSMVPFVGTLLGILPVFLVTLSSGDTFTAYGILIYGFVVVGSTDNIIRLFVLKKLDNVHPLITLIGVIVGVPLFGFIGLIFGPLLISLFLVILKIYKREYGLK